MEKSWNDQTSPREPEAGMGHGEVFRLALISTPRSGNTWFRYLLASVFDLEPMPLYNPLTADWDNLPRRCVLMTHWPRTEPFAGLLESHGFRVVTLVRHPLDVLISILHFTVHNPEITRWVDGLGGDERAIVGKSPLSADFLRYAMGERAKVLLSVSRQWWSTPQAVQVRYEDLVRDTAGTLARVAADCGHEPQSPIATSIEAHTLEKLRTREGFHHWRGRPGHWKLMLPPLEAGTIASIHPEAFREMGYACDPDESLTAARADLNWTNLACRPGKRTAVAAVS